ncbi:DUF2200 domain-containing protein [Pseudoxanthomonas sangjuensis]|uniref:DUF2200 family protein n=1 Tax=Pseudoxanthomonas sangjuensis TaxID=1503750 RepID=UPI001391D34E|nr:DUF2200 family protein [Pseudoxanthomonas sangjuensis]KAF1715079.1 hypothetical protein CSC71_02375 [Pseudoxanthomonas sangjuensis]
MEHRIFGMAYAGIHRAYEEKLARKGLPRGDVAVLERWLTGYSEAELAERLQNATVREFFDGAARYNPESGRIRGIVCGVRVEDVEDPTMRRIRQMDKLVDERARGKALEKIMGRK